MGTLAEHPQIVAFRGLTGAGRDAALMEVELVRREAEALLAAMIADVDQTVSYADDAHRNTVCWVQAVTNCSRSEATGRVRTARMIRDLPVVGDALLDGHLGPAQTTEIARLHGNDRARPHLPAAAALLVEHACLLPHDGFRKVCQRFEQYADPDGAHRDHETSRANRHVSLTPDGAGFRFRAEGDAMSGALLETVLARFTVAEFDADWAEGKAIHGDKMCAGLMRRTARQRRFDAFLAMCRAAADARATNALVPLVNIICDQQTVTDTIRDHFDDPTATRWTGEGTGFSGGPTGDPTGDPAEWIKRRCETTSGAPVDRHDLLAALLLGNVRRVVTDGAGRVIDLGRRQRLFTGAAREAALLGGDRCVFPGCHVRDGRVQIDHTLAWAAKRGPTSTTNANIECGHHNLGKDRHGHTRSRDPNMPAAWITQRADGTRIGIRTSPATSPPATEPATDLADDCPRNTDIA